MLRRDKVKPVLVVGIALALMMILVVGCAQTGGGATSSDVSKLDKRVSTLEKDVNQQKTKINPGLGTVMIEYGDRFSRAWFGAQAGNWDMVKYQIKEMREIQEVGEIDRPKRATPLKNFESQFLDPLDKAGAEKDIAKFNDAYNAAITGCNGCHAASADNVFKSFSFIKIGLPKSDPTGGQLIYTVP